MANADNTLEPPTPANDSEADIPYKIHSNKETAKEIRLMRALWGTSKSVRRKPGKLKPERVVTVGECPGVSPIIPWIRLRGYWLEQAGFPLKTRVRVQIEHGRLILTPETAAAP
jgi:toxic protein SymE